MTKRKTHRKQLTGDTRTLGLVITQEQWDWVNARAAENCRSLCGEVRFLIQQAMTKEFKVGR